MWVRMWFGPPLVVRWSSGLREQGSAQEKEAEMEFCFKNFLFIMIFILFILFIIYLFFIYYDLNRSNFMHVHKGKQP
jgi:hypothetical protein